MNRFVLLVLIIILFKLEYYNILLYWVSFARPTDRILLACPARCICEWMCTSQVLLPSAGRIGNQFERSLTDCPTGRFGMSLESHLLLSLDFGHGPCLSIGSHGYSLRLLQMQRLSPTVDSSGTWPRSTGTCRFADSASELILHCCDLGS